MEAVLAHPVTVQLRMWWEMTRPRVLLLVLFTGFPVFGLVDGGFPRWQRAFVVLFGTALAGAASSTLNAYLERETDAHMARTRNRPLPAAAVQPLHALAIGLILAISSTWVLYVVGGAFAAAVGVATILFYVFVYTLWLKPRTPQNIVIGGAAGATAPLIAEAALDGRLTFASWLLFLIIFLWTPPHFWALAIYRKDEYAAAGFPMMPNVVGDVATRRQSVAYTVLLLALTLAPVGMGMLSWGYGVAALLAGSWFLWRVIGSIRANDPKVDYGVFRASISYLFALFGAMLLDQVGRALLA
jgi:protoheme IX farnesyltransferase